MKLTKRKIHPKKKGYQKLNAEGGTNNEILCMGQGFHAYLHIRTSQLLIRDYMHGQDRLLTILLSDTGNLKYISKF